jgi:pilus assembly protein CpaB
MKPKTMILAVVAVGCGLVASYLTNHLLTLRAQNGDEQTVKVLCTTQRVSPYVVLNDERQFVLRDFPVSLAPKKAITDFAKIKGQRLKVMLEAEKPVVEDDLLNKDDAGLEGQLKPGQRAIAIKVDTVTIIGGFCRPGVRVDVYCTTRGTEAQSKIILQNMLILAVDTTNQRNPDQPTIIGQTVTLAASPEEAAQLTLASSVGELRLALRGFGDTKPLGQVAVKSSDLGKPVSDAVEGGSFAGEPASPRPSAPRVEIPGNLPPVEEKKDTVAAAPPKKEDRFHTIKITLGQSKQDLTYKLEGEEDDSVPPPSELPRPVRPQPRPEVKQPPATPDKPADKGPGTLKVASPRSKSMGRQ